MNEALQGLSHNVSQSLSIHRFYILKRLSTNKGLECEEKDESR